MTTCGQECYDAIKDCVAKMVAADPRIRVAVNEQDDTREHCDRAAEFLKIDEQRCGRDFALYKLRARVAGIAAGGLADFADVIMFVRANSKAAYEAVKDTVIAWDRFFGEEVRAEWRDIWEDKEEVGS